MYIQDTLNHPAHFQEEQLREIIINLNVGSPLTIFAPSGFGKSLLLTHLAYSGKYQYTNKNFRRLIFAYVDVNEVVTELRNHLSQSQLPTATTTQTQILEKKLQESIATAAEVNHIRVGLSENLIEYLDKLLSSHKSLHMFVILDGVEALFASEFGLTRDLLKHIRDRYKKQFDYIFATSKAEYIEANYDNLGSLATLFGQKIMILPLTPNARSLYTITTENRWLPRLKLWLHPQLGIKLDKIDEFTGGYAPYIKYIFASGSLAVEDSHQSSELEFASERFLRSFTNQQVQGMKYIARGKSIDHSSKLYKFLYSLGAIKTSAGRDVVFSPIMQWYLNRGAFAES